MYWCRNNKKHHPSLHTTFSRRHKQKSSLFRCAASLLIPTWIIALFVYWNNISLLQSVQQFSSNSTKPIDVNDILSFSGKEKIIQPQHNTNNDRHAGGYIEDDDYTKTKNVNENNQSNAVKNVNQITTIKSSHNEVKNDRSDNIHHDLIQHETTPHKQTYTWFNKRTKTQIHATSIQDAIQQLSNKPWTPIKDTNWCVPKDSKFARKTRIKNLQKRSFGKRDTTYGLIYVKVYKTASSTAAGVALTIAKNVAKRLNHPESCPASADHGDKFKRRQDPTFMFSFVREPAKRAISSYFFFSVNRSGRNITDEGFINVVSSLKSFELNYMIPEKIRYNDESRPSSVSFEQVAIGEIQNNILNAYNFVGVTERMEESLVVLKMLMNIQDEDIIVLSAKQSPGYDDGGHKNTCRLIPKPTMTAGMEEYMNGEFRKHNVDYILYDVINKMLDLTIDLLGHEKVQEGIRQHRELKEIATKYCTKEAIFPCSDEGVKRTETNCFFGDSGCGHECISRVLEQYKRGELPEKPQQ